MIFNEFTFFELCHVQRESAILRFSSDAAYIIIIITRGMSNEDTEYVVTPLIFQNC